MTSASSQWDHEHPPYCYAYSCEACSELASQTPAYSVIAHQLLPCAKSSGAFPGMDSGHACSKLRSVTCPSLPLLPLSFHSLLLPLSFHFLCSHCPSLSFAPTVLLLITAPTVLPLLLLPLSFPSSYCLSLPLAPLFSQYGHSFRRSFSSSTQPNRRIATAFPGSDSVCLQQNTSWP